MIRALMKTSLILALAVSTGTAWASGPHSKNEPKETVIFWGAGAEVDGAQFDWLENEGGALVNWDGYAWVGGDDLKFRLEAEGEAFEGGVESSELRALLSWNVAEFWDLQAGIRHDFEPGGLTWAAAGFQGLAPYFFETEARLFISEEADVAFRFRQTYDLLLTQRLIAQPHIELNAYAQDIPELSVGAGLANVEAGLQLRYEFTRKFAPYVDLVYERKLGETSQITQALGEDPEVVTLRFGLRIRL